MKAIKNQANYRRQMMSPEQLVAEMIEKQRQQAASGSRVRSEESKGPQAPAAPKAERKARATTPFSYQFQPPHEIPTASPDPLDMIVERQKLAKTSHQQRRESPYKARKDNASELLSSRILFQITQSRRNKHLGSFYMRKKSGTISSNSAAKSPVNVLSDKSAASRGGPRPQGVTVLNVQQLPPHLDSKTKPSSNLDSPIYHRLSKNTKDSDSHAKLFQKHATRRSRHGAGLRASDKRGEQHNLDLFVL